MPVAASWRGMCFLLPAGKPDVVRVCQKPDDCGDYLISSGCGKKTLVLLPFSRFLRIRIEYASGSNFLAFMSIIRVILKKDMFSGKKYI